MFTNIGIQWRPWKNEVWVEDYFLKVSFQQQLFGFRIERSARKTLSTRLAYDEKLSASDSTIRQNLFSRCHVKVAQFWTTKSTGSDVICQPFKGNGGKAFSALRIDFQHLKKDTDSCTKGPWKDWLLLILCTLLTAPHLLLTSSWEYLICRCSYIKGLNLIVHFSCTITELKKCIFSHVTIFGQYTLNAWYFD